jgi:hypothetical protein
VNACGGSPSLSLRGLPWSGELFSYLEWMQTLPKVYSGAYGLRVTPRVANTSRVGMLWWACLTVLLIALVRRVLLYISLATLFAEVASSGVRLLVGRIGARFGARPLGTSVFRWHGWEFGHF